jgi:hypothetical protein
MIRYNLSLLEPSVRMSVIDDVQSRGIPYSYQEMTLSISEQFEAILDHVVLRAEQSGDIARERQSIARAILLDEGASPCEVCGRAPAAPLRQRLQVGLLIIAKTVTIESHLCLDCGNALRQKVRKQNLIKGWGGLRSAAMNPVIMATNEREYRTFTSTIEGNT